SVFKERPCPRDTPLPKGDVRVTLRCPPDRVVRGWPRSCWGLYGQRFRLPAPPTPVKELGVRGSRGQPASTRRYSFLPRRSSSHRSWSRSAAVTTRPSGAGSLFTYAPPWPTVRRASLFEVETPASNRSSATSTPSASTARGTVAVGTSPASA